eukprot:TRINITY_DN27527_c0_g1_i1.p1 TRINITY_DN27527_c0_g1~~TRINITY_DN27527_c0_g1_i1.p1  ORF type:complete len:449 (+),score=204.03 TRINITY_DN27527_c0_g1_i1:70-1416(+)
MNLLGRMSVQRDENLKSLLDQALADGAFLQSENNVLKEENAALSEEVATLRSKLVLADRKEKELEERLDQGGSGDWAKLKQLKTDFEARVHKHPNIKAFPNYVSFLAMGQTVTGKLAAATREAALDVMLDHHTLTDLLADFDAARQRNGHELDAHRQKVVEARNTADKLPKGTKKAEALDTLLDECEAEVRYISEKLGGDGALGSVQEGLCGWQNKRKEKQKAALQRIATLQEMTRKHFRNMEIFTEKTEQLFAGEMQKFTKAIGEESTGYGRALFDVYQLSQQRCDGLIESKRHLIDARQAKCDDLEAQLNNMADVDPAGDAASKALAETQSDLAKLRGEVEKLESRQGEVGGLYSAYFQKLTEKAVDVKHPVKGFHGAAWGSPGTPANSRKRKRGDCDDAHDEDVRYLTPDSNENDESSTPHPKKRARLSTRVANFAMSLLFSPGE